MRLKEVVGTLSVMALSAGVLNAKEGVKKDLSTKPNVIIIYTDDQDLLDLSCYGGKTLTPHIDRLALEGMRFTRFHVSSAVCNPSRFALLTGRYPSRSLSQQKSHPAGGYVNLGWEAYIYPETTSLPLAMQKNGYFTGMVGKWMQGISGKKERFANDESANTPEAAAKIAQNWKITLASVKHCGFDYVASVYMDNIWNWLPKSMRVHNQEWIAKGALDFLDQAKGRPFFLYMATTLPHSPSPVRSIKADPRICAKGYLEKAVDVQPSRQNVLDRVKAAGISEEQACHTWIDDSVGAVLKKLDALGIADNTIVIFASDHGDNGKFTCYNAGTQMPFIIRWPAKVKPGQVNSQLCASIDVAPTLYELCGITPSADNHIDGQTLVPLLIGKGDYSRKSLYTEITQERAVVTEDGFKYIAVRYPPELQAKVDSGMKFSHWGIPMDKVHHIYNAHNKFPGYFDADQLYDLKNDPQEQYNLASNPKYKEKLAELKQKLAEYSQKLPHKFGEFKQ